MNNKENQKQYKGQSGNVLFLILIAVALFAALSYAVTSSSRSGGGNANEETNLVNSASVTQYPSGLRTSIIRMMVSKGVDAIDLEFNLPADLDDCTEDEACVFHPAGGGASPSTVPADMMDSGAQGAWYFTGHFELEDIGTTTGTGTGNDIVAYLPGISDALCTKINEELGVSGDTIVDFNIDVTANQMINAYAFAAPTDTIGTTSGAAGLDGQPFACLEDSAGENVYYHVLIER